jgi:hypothetical protein
MLCAADYNYLNTNGPSLQFSQLPDQLSSIPGLQTLRLNRHDVIGGTLPDSYSNLPITEMVISASGVSGTLPASWGSNWGSSLVELGIMQGPSLSGTQPSPAQCCCACFSSCQ